MAAAKLDGQEKPYTKLAANEHLKHNAQLLEKHTGLSGDVLIWCAHLCHPGVTRLSFSDHCFTKPITSIKSFDLMLCLYDKQLCLPFLLRLPHHLIIEFLVTVNYRRFHHCHRLFRTVEQNHEVSHFVFPFLSVSLCFLCSFIFSDSL